MKKIFFGLLIFLLFAGVSPILGQVNPAQVNVNELSDSRINQILNMVRAQGLTLEQAVSMASAQGATPQQINQLMQRIREMNGGTGQPGITTYGANGRFTDVNREQFSQKEEIAASERARKVFGFNLFNSENLTFEPSVNIPVPPNYVMGVGDELIINVWGASQNVYNVQVDQNGTVYIPEIGPVQVMGMSFEESRNLIKRRLMSIYSGMAGAYPNTWAEVSLSSLRSIKVNVVGEALIPGTYTLPATASAFNALYLSGGPGENGSFRNVQIIRDNKVIQTIDVYDFLLRGNTQGNVVLRDQDIIFIPTYSRRVETAGSFKRNAFFELKDSETMTDLIGYAGGFADTAYTGGLTIERITATQRRVSDVPASVFDTFLLQNGDIVTARTIIDRYDNRVVIDGAVFRPGIYELTPGLTVYGLITKAGGVSENVFGNRGLIVRLQEDLSPMNISFNVDEVVKGLDDVILMREDSVIIETKSNLRENRFVRILGQVQEPGVFVYRDNMTLQDLIFMAKGFTEAASESYIEVSRRNSYEKASEISNEMVLLNRFEVSRDLTLKKEEQDFILQPYDYVYVRMAPSYYTQRTVVVRGEVMYPGEYSIESKTERVSDLILRAGGLTSQAYARGAMMIRAPEDIGRSQDLIQVLMEDSLLGGNETKLEVDKLELRLEEILKNPDSPYNYIVKDEDEIIIPEVIEEIRVAGEILNPIALAYESGKSARYYIERAGGFSTNAHKSKVYVIGPDGTSKVTKRFIFRDYPAVEQGSQIVVPLKPVKESNTAQWLGMTSALSSLTIAIAAVLRVL